MINGDISNVQDQEYKISVNREGYIDKISRSNENGIGFHIGINYIKNEYINVFKEYLEKSDDSNYFDVALQALIDKGVKFKAIDIQDNFCMEIDHLDELQTAKNYVKKNYNK